MAESVDAADLKSAGEFHTGSTPVLSIKLLVDSATHNKIKR